MKSVKTRVYLEDEAPRLGCGWRTLLIKVGRKWVHFLDPYNGNRTKLPMAKAEPIIRSLSLLTK